MINMDETNQIQPVTGISTPVVSANNTTKLPFFTSRIQLFLGITFMLIVFIIFIFLIIYVFRPLRHQRVSFYESSGKQLKTEILAAVPDGYRIGAGLTQKNSIQENEGMLYKFDTSGTFPFWMKNMKFSLDVIWIQDTEVVDFEENLTVPFPNQDPESLRTYRPSTNADKVIEVQAGFVKKFDISVGDKIVLHELK